MSPAPEPEILTMYNPGAVGEATLMVSVEVADVTEVDSRTLFGLNTAVRPAGKVAGRAIPPENPFRPPMMIDEDPEEPAVMERLEGLADIVKSTALTRTVTDRVSVPLVAVTVAE